MRFVQLERELATVAAALGEGGVPVLVLKGYALARTYYASPAHRPMSYLDVGVPASRHGEAEGLLARRGLRTTSGEGRPLAVGAGMHASTLVAEAATEIDLHHNVLSCSRWDGADDGFWARDPHPGPEPHAVRLSAADQLLHACLHGYRENLGVNPVRWMAGAVAILDRGSFGAAEWSGLLDEAGRYRCERVLCASLAFLAERLGAPVPVEVLDRHRRRCPSGRSMLPRFRFSGPLPRRPTMAWRLTAAWRDYRRLHGGPPPAPRAVLGFPAWVARRRGVASLPAFARELVRRLPAAGA